MRLSACEWPWLTTSLLLYWLSQLVTIIGDTHDIGMIEWITMTMICHTPQWAMKKTYHRSTLHYTGFALKDTNLLAARWQKTPNNDWLTEWFDFKLYHLKGFPDGWGWSWPSVRILGVPIISFATHAKSQEFRRWMSRINNVKHFWFYPCRIFSLTPTTCNLLLICDSKCSCFSV